MPIESHEGGGITITGNGDLPNGGLSFYTLITAHSAMKMHVESGGRMRLTRMATPANIRAVLNSNYPNRPDGEFKGKTAKTLLKEIIAEVQRQQDLHKAADPNFQNEAFDRILNQ